MNASTGLFWLSSYPKSGNTWFRIFLANVLNLSTENQPVYLNHVDKMINDHITTTRTWVNKASGLNADTLTDDEIDALLPNLYAQYNDEHTHVTYHKIHRAYSYVNGDQPLIPLDRCLGAIYFIRNPLDVAISLANHFNFSIDDAIHMMGDKTFALDYYSLRQRLFSWSMHVESWVESKANNLLILRYEDMIRKPLEVFTQAVQFLKLPVSSEIIEQAISHATFDKLKQFENNIGFTDKPPKLKHFFRKGIAGDWKTTLTDQQIQQVIADHRKVMRKFGYLNKNNEPVVD